MNVINRGIRNAFRNWIRSGSIILILALSIGLIIAMLAARQAVSDRIEAVKSSVGNTVSISPAGVRGFEGGGEALTQDQIAKVAALDHVSSVTSQLSDRLTTDTTTNLSSAIELGSLGQRRAQESNSNSSSQTTTNAENSTAIDSTNTDRPAGFNPMASVTITGVDNTSSDSIWGGSSVTWTAGSVFDATKTENVAAVGTSLAEKNDLSVGSTFTAYDTTLTVVGIYDAGNTFANNGVFVSLGTLQKISDQSNSVTSATATIDSVDNLDTATTAITSELGDAADVTNSKETTENALQPLESVKTVALFSLIGALVAGAIVILLTMIMIVRERRREIGVMKAIGSSNKGIVGQFITEAITLTSIALVIGLLIGIVASTPLTSALVSNSSSSQTRQGGPGGGMGGGPRGFGRAGLQTVQNITSSVGLETVAYGVGATLLIAILGSALPAYMISKVKPAEAMRSE